MIVAPLGGGARGRRRVTGEPCARSITARSMRTAFANRLFFSCGIYNACGESSQNLGAPSSPSCDIRQQRGRCGSVSSGRRRIAAWAAAPLVLRPALYSSPTRGSSGTSGTSSADGDARSTLRRAHEGPIELARYAFETFVRLGTSRSDRSPRSAGHAAGRRASRVSFQGRSPRDIFASGAHRARRHRTGVSESALAADARRRARELDLAREPCFSAA